MKDGERQTRAGVNGQSPAEADAASAAAASAINIGKENDAAHLIRDAASEPPSTATENDGDALQTHDAVFDRPSTAVTSRSSEPRLCIDFQRDSLIHRLLIQRFLTQSSNDINVRLDAEDENELLNILSSSAAVNDEVESAAGNDRASTAVDGAAGRLPVDGALQSWAVCQVCLEQRWLHKRPCCSTKVCDDCLKIYLSIKVNEGVIKIECCSSKCKALVNRDEITARLDTVDREKFHQHLVEANSSPWLKTCPRCSHVTTFSKVKPNRMLNTRKYPQRSRITCCECGLWWCFSCHAPWHPGLTCRQYRKGDRLMKTWAKQMQQGQLNAQRCPRCQAYIQRTTGCDHMHCIRCKTDFCYRCGDRLRKLRFFGDHYSKLSVFGCKYRYKADQPWQRKLVRGAVFGSKLVIVPLVGTLGACACVIALGFGMFILPVYGGLRLYNKLTSKYGQQLLSNNL